MSIPFPFSHCKNNSLALSHKSCILTRKRYPNYSEKLPKISFLAKPHVLEIKT